MMQSNIHHHQTHSQEEYGKGKIRLNKEFIEQQIDIARGIQIYHPIEQTEAEDTPNAPKEHN
jgi:hypothetical protein